MGGNINLTKMWMAAIISVFVAITLFGSYINFCAMHLPGQPAQCNIEPKYQKVFNNLSTQYDDLSSVGLSVGDKNLIQSILNFGANAITGTVNVFVMGLTAIENFFNMIPVIGNIFTLIGNVFPGFAGLVSLLILILGVYVGMRIIQSASNKMDLP